MTRLSPEHEQLFHRLREEVAEAVVVHGRAAERQGLGPPSQADRESFAAEAIGDALERHYKRCLDAGDVPLDEAAEDALAETLRDSMFRMDWMQAFLDDPEISNVEINGCDVVFVEYADGRKVRAPAVASTDAELIRSIADFGRRVGLSERQFDQAHPEINLQLPDGSRLFATAWVCARPSVSIRKHRYLRVTLAELERLGMVTFVLAAFLAAAVRARLNILVCGATNAGKTTLLRALCSEIAPGERIVTVETDLELGLDRFPEDHPDVVALEVREPNVEGVGGVDASRLVRNTLRMRPDRVLLGEGRADEMVDMLEVMMNSNGGSMGTVHAASSEAAFEKITLLAIKSRQHLDANATNRMVALAVQLVVFIDTDSDGRRHVASVREVVGHQGADGVVSNEVFAPGPDGRAVPAAPLRTRTLQRLVAHGLDPELVAAHRGWDG